LTIASQLESLPANAALLAQQGVFTDKPAVILSARTAPEHRRKEHTATAAGLPQGEHILAENSNHWIMQQQPELVIRAIERVVESYFERHSARVFETAAAGK
jgi:pimeloyl-ACP methyl ester carboxylesterase